MSEIDDFRKELQEELRRNQSIFNESENKKYLDRIQALSQAEVSAIVPKGTDSAVYNNLITVLKAATRHNVQQAELVAQIKQLGKSAVDLARLVPQLAPLL
jgi:hypothetical protein